MPARIPNLHSDPTRDSCNTGGWRTRHVGFARIAYTSRPNRVYRRNRYVPTASTAAKMTIHGTAAGTFDSRINRSGM